jgi:CHAT domain-containing protein
MEVILLAGEAKKRKSKQEDRSDGILTGFRGMANARMGNTSQAFEEFSAALPALMKESGKYDSDRLNRTILESYIDFLGGIAGTPGESKLGLRAADEAFRIAGYLGGQAAHTAFGQSSARAMAAYDPELADLVRREQDMDKQIDALEETLSSALMGPPDQQDAGALNTLQATIANVAKAREAILAEINRRFPKYANFTKPQPATVAEVQKNLHRNEAFISIFSTNEKIYLWAIPHRGEPSFTVGRLTRKELAKLIADLRRSLDPDPHTLGDIPAFDVQKAYELYRHLLKPVEPAWKDAADLIVTVNGELGQQPLALLPTEQVKLAEGKNELFAHYRDIPWLIRKASVTMLPSVNALITLRSLPDGDPQRKAFIGFGDPIFNLQQLAMEKPGEARSPEGLRASGEAKVQVRGVRVAGKGHLDNSKITSVRLDELERLPDTAEEIRSIARVLNADIGTNVFLGSDFSHRRLKTMNLADRKVIAFATHALVPGDLDGLDEPALALSSPVVTGEKEDGLLTIDEILKLKLNADWVVLSACNTGASAGQGAEAVTGLGTAFFYAGARSLLVSMWPVETTSARRLVTGIFLAQERNSGLPRAQALRRSMVEMIDRETLKDEATGRIVASYAHPLFWAPFVIVGDPGKNL